MVKAYDFGSYMRQFDPDNPRNRRRGGIGRHLGLKIQCCKNNVPVQVWSAALCQVAPDYDGWKAVEKV